MSSKARRADYSIFFPVDSSPREEAKESRTTKPRALRSWDRHGARAASQPSPIREPLYHQALGTTSPWIHLLGGDEPDPQPSRCYTVTGATVHPKLCLFIFPEACSLPVLLILSRECVLSFVPVFPAPQTWVSVKQMNGLKKYQFDPHSIC